MGCQLLSLHRTVGLHLPEIAECLGRTHQAPRLSPCVPPAVLLRIYIYGYLHNYLSASIGMGLVQRRSSGR